MSRFMDKLLSGQGTAPEDWKKHLLEAHSLAPGMSPQAFGDCRNGAGLNSYEWLALSTERVRNPKSIVDLACGDGFLIPILQKKLANDVSYVGIDMSAKELELAEKRKLARARFHQAMADNTGLPTESVDVVFSHMALMLMLPLDPVLAEIQRVLKPGGMLTGVIGNREKKDGLFSTLQQTVRTFLGEKFPSMQKPMTGDPRMETEVGLREALRGFSSLEIIDDSFEATLDPKAAWDHVKHLYLIEGLPESSRDELREKLTQVFVKSCRSDGTLTFDFPMRKFLATR